MRGEGFLLLLRGGSLLEWAFESAAARLLQRESVCLLVIELAWSKWLGLAVLIH